MLKKIPLILSFLIILSFFSYGQEQKGYLVPFIIINGDTIPEINLPSVWIISPRVFKSKQEERRWNKLVRNVKKVYPYALICQIKMKEYEAQMDKLSSDSEKRTLMKKAEKELQDQFEEQVKNMTFSQGKILIKLIDRQTDKTAYALVKEFRGNIRAIFWGSLARIFGINLNTEYDAEGTDKEIEQIVQLIDMGII